MSIIRFCVKSRINWQSSLVLLFLITGSVCAKVPDCASPNGWPASIAFAKLKNAGIVKNTDLNLKKTEVHRLASEKIGKDLYRQVLEIVFFKTDGHVIRVVTMSDSSFEECSMGDVEVFLVAKEFGSLERY